MAERKSMADEIREQLERELGPDAEQKAMEIEASWDDVTRNAIRSLIAGARESLSNLDPNKSLIGQIQFAIKNLSEATAIALGVLPSEAMQLIAGAARAAEIARIFDILNEEN